MKHATFIASSIAVVVLIVVTTLNLIKPSSNTEYVIRTVTTNQVDTSDLTYDATAYKIIANGEPEQMLLDIRMNGNKFLEVSWRDPHHNNKPQDVTIRTTYKPVITQDGGAWKITFERD